MSKILKKVEIKERAPAHCLYCGKMTTSGHYIVNPKASYELPCCSQECYDKTKEFIEWDSHNRMKYYGILAILVIVNLVIIGLDFKQWWRWIPMFGIGTVTCLYPLVFIRYERYQAFGIHTTFIIIRTIGAAISIGAIALMIL